MRSLARFASSRFREESDARPTWAHNEQRMRRLHAPLIFFLASSATLAAIAACTSESRPPVTDTPGVLSRGSGSGPGADGGDDDGGGVTFASFAGFNPTGLTADGDTLYVTLVPIDTTTSAEVARVDPSGVVTVLVNNAIAPSAPTVSSGALYYIDTPTGSSGSSILSLNLADLTTPPTTLISALDKPSGLAVGGSSLVVATALGGTGVGIESISSTGTSTQLTQVGGEYSPSGIATDGAQVYFAAKATGGGQIFSVPVNVGPADSLWSGSDTGTLGPVVVANANVYFSLTADPNGIIYSVPAAGGTALPIVTGLTQPSAIAVNSAYVYYTSNTQTGGIFRAPLNPDSGIATTEIATVANAQFLVLGATAVYVTTDQAIVRATQ